VKEEERLRLQREEKERKQVCNRSLFITLSKAGTHVPT